MATTASTTSGKATTHSTTPRKTMNDAIELLIDDHNKVKKMFKQFEKISKNNGGEGKEELARQICKELTVHAQLEEEIFYPAVREGIDDDALMNEAMVEHALITDFSWKKNAIEYLTLYKKILENKGELWLTQKIN